MKHVNWDQIPTEEPQPGVRTRRFDSDGMTIVRYEFEPGAQFPSHSHPEEQVVMILAGQITFSVDGRELLLGPGDICHVTPHQPHGAIAGAERVQFLNLLSPRRTSDAQISYH